MGRLVISTILQKPAQRIQNVDLKYCKEGQFNTIAGCPGPCVELGGREVKENVCGMNECMRA